MQGIIATAVCHSVMQNYAFSMLFLAKVQKGPSLCNLEKEEPVVGAPQREP